MENTLNHHRYLLVLDENIITNNEISYLRDHFFGKTIFSNNFDIKRCSNTMVVYLCGDIKNMLDRFEFNSLPNLFVIDRFSTNIPSECKTVDPGEVPINVFNVGVHFRRIFPFNFNKNYYSAITSEHEFQDLGISGKPGKAYRKGIYLTDVVQSGDDIRFKLLRCSTNLGGPTDNFRQTDREILTKLNELCGNLFSDKVELNHVLAQTYFNAAIDDKERKAKIAEHSDKTKDMPRNAIMAFCSFYEGYIDDGFSSINLNRVRKSDSDVYDFCYNDTSVLTTLRFRLKDAVTDPKLKKEFDVILYPNSAFVMSLTKVFDFS